MAVAAGGRSQTLAGLAGLGDLVLTCHRGTEPQPARRVPTGSGAETPGDSGQHANVAEGVHTTYAAMELSERLAVELPIARQVHAILREGRDPREALRELDGALAERRIASRRAMGVRRAPKTRRHAKPRAGPGRSRGAA